MFGCQFFILLLAAFQRFNRFDRVVIVLQLVRCHRFAEHEQFFQALDHLLVLRIKAHDHLSRRNRFDDLPSIRIKKCHQRIFLDGRIVVSNALV